MRKNFTALLAVAVIITESSIPASAIAKTPALEALGYARVDGCGLFGENVDLYVQTKHPGSTAMMFNVTWTTDGKLLPTKTIGFTLKEYNAEVRETLEPLIDSETLPNVEGFAVYIGISGSPIGLMVNCSQR